ncbi:MAG TPA: hypothetical protein VFJ85_11415 [Acidimicrobiales bacterium]|nr:hypothetical protein [Acidimicrobiales bacterium]
MADLSAARFLRRALADLRRADPQRYAEIAGRLERAPTRCDVGGERFSVTAEGGRVSVLPGWVPWTLGCVVLAPGAVLDLAGGDATLEQLLAAEAVVVRGAADTLLELWAAVTAFVLGAAGAPALVRHLGDYRAWVLGD